MMKVQKDRFGPLSLNPKSFFCFVFVHSYFFRTYLFHQRRSSLQRNIRTIHHAFIASVRIWWPLDCNKQIILENLKEKSVVLTGGSAPVPTNTPIHCLSTGSNRNKEPTALEKAVLEHLQKLGKTRFL